MMGWVNTHFFRSSYYFTGKRNEREKTLVTPPAKKSFHGFADDVLGQDHPPLLSRPWMAAHTQINRRRPAWAQPTSNCLHVPNCGSLDLSLSNPIIIIITHIYLSIYNKRYVQYSMIYNTIKILLSSVLFQSA